ncbi:iron-sulfur cluster assembly scaffold protein [Candidatus Falkowbacteria bacterium RIFOXYB2_FULL_38_15]|uniref:Iron-sulfur cluster assembly scaffold protein n=1 Tax=Candidatus Falkowbacteria bacterium RIFOXYA2_FULL_38_12 TaxID=1797993 RepID=A0A1F5S4C7_9BACT|nr:MAG: iron-sulfur cluster assembly scaffold protein [Candidatus Falkowbacteria bacterium RIFOXYA2_FULL_38_12]OGF33122.1 MAG: iron-sulfur cluster assembly scaffold protein [Candidatus Falkowbacteria bacterium RIFOXYB2_FULL_38_15]OGF43963.1 MAG: iron-sulfur cluster assembly scaffold protein [Candidatus Falkowbacteria bacterium RIFOXYD2_FULL_39_16]
MVQALYTKKVMEHFKKPHNQGVIKDATIVGESGNPLCGDVMKLYIKIDKKKIKGKETEYIKDIKFETLGCAAAIATSSMITDLVKGKPIDEADNVTKANIADSLGGLPPIKLHCSVLAVEALHKALKEYKTKK